MLNWVGSARKVGITNFFVACLDDMLLAELQRRGIPSLRLPSSLGAEELQWGSDIFKERVSHNTKANTSTLHRYEASALHLMENQ